MSRADERAQNHYAKGCARLMKKKDILSVHRISLFLGHYKLQNLN